jgi:diguanylate cyclase (GGDEF)-like protein/PAS domain S-box-containing protein
MTKGNGGLSRTPREWSDEIARLEEIIRALMDQPERSIVAHGSDFGSFQTTAMLNNQVRLRIAELEAELRESDAKFRSIVDQSLLGIDLIEDGKFIYTNKQFGRMFGYSEDEIREITPLDVVVESDRARIIAQNIRKRARGEIVQPEYSFRGLRKDRSVNEIESYNSELRIDRRTLLASSLLDVTIRKQTERNVLALNDQLREQSLHDQLTGLHNRRYLDEALERELTLADRAGRPVTLIIGDLDHFKDVNDCHGHLAGDEVLRRIANLMRLNSRSTDICCRYGGEEFVLILPGVPQAAGVERAEKLRQDVEATSIEYGNSLIAVTSSFGVATFPDDGRTADQLTAAADNALYAAKTRGRNRVSTLEPPRGAIDQASVRHAADAAAKVALSELTRSQFRGNCVTAADNGLSLGNGTSSFDAPVRSEGSPLNSLVWCTPDPANGSGGNQLGIMSELGGAMARHEFEIFYQPIICVDNGRPCGAEALLRWHHPVRGCVSPSEFIPGAESSGLIFTLGAWVIHHACQQLSEWRAQRVVDDSFYMSVNVAPSQLSGPRLVATVQEAALATGLPYSSLVIEVTESSLMPDVAQGIVQLNALRQIGVRIAVDDFGAGYSSLARLRQLPIDIVKIDKSFFDELLHSEADRSLIRGLTEASHALSRLTVAEGIESVEQLRVAASLGCDAIQGYVFGQAEPPLQAAATITELIHASATTLQMLSDTAGAG